MNWKNTDSRYGALSITVHWLMFLLLVAVYACIELREFYPKGSDLRSALKTWHFMLGLSVLVLVSLRLGLRLSQVIPSIQKPPPHWQMLSAKAIHISLYVFMILMPLAGWLILSAAGKPIPFFGVELPALISKNKDLAEWIEEIHETVGSIGYYIIGLHTAAALLHHYFYKDNTLVRMLPGK